MAKRPKVRALTMDDLMASVTPDEEARLLDEMVEVFSEYLPDEDVRRIKSMADEARSEARRRK